MDDDDRPRVTGDIANRLSSESLEAYSQDELAARIQTLELEIARTRSHMEKAAAHRQAADALFGSSASGPPS